MANKVKGETSIKFEGKKYKLSFGFNAICEFEGETGENTLAIMRRVETGSASARDLRMMMWAGLREHHSNLTLEDAGRILSADVGALIEAMNAGFGSADEGAGGEGNAMAVSPTA